MTVIPPGPVFQIPAIIPGGIYSDLETAGILTSDIYYRFNEDNYKWVSQTNWTYETAFNLAELIGHLEDKKTILLNCEGTVLYPARILNKIILHLVDLSCF